MSEIDSKSINETAYKLGFIGVGNMGSAILKAILSSGLVNPRNIYITSRSPQKLINYAASGVQITSTNRECVQNSDIVFICVKPKDLNAVLKEVKRDISSKTIISPIAGKDYASFYETVSPSTRILTVLPNTPLEVGAGVIGYTKAESTLLSTEMQFFEQVFASSATLIALDSGSLGKLSAITGSGPAFVALFADALIRSAEAEGFTSDVARQMVLKTITGTAELITKSGKEPSLIAKEVCSPGGTTIEGVNVLNAYNFEGIVRNAITATVHKWYKG